MSNNSANFDGSSFTGNFSQGNVKGDMTANINSENTDNSNSKNIHELISELQASVESDSSLNNSDKQEALQEVNKLKEAAKNPENSNNISSVKSASRMLRGIATELPNATKFVEACTKLLPLITKIFGL
ncbi:MAG: hypothetical protein MJK14_05430 [Rivularia sp. ALOHA_DT_140]|nr:hypothetical protein [Rivularia sp. ALOHA_DT_140]